MDLIGIGLRRDRVYTMASVLICRPKKDYSGSKLIQYSHLSQFSFSTYQCFPSRNSAVTVSFLK
jgi:hypothetical protein